MCPQVVVKAKDPEPGWEPIPLQPVIESCPLDTDLSEMGNQIPPVRIIDVGPASVTEKASLSEFALFRPRVDPSIFKNPMNGALHISWVE